MTPLPPTEQLAILRGSVPAKGRPRRCRRGSRRSEQSASRADQARLAALTATGESTAAMVSVRKAEILKFRAKAQLAAAESAIASAQSGEAREQAEDANAKATAKFWEQHVERVHREAQ